MFLNEKERIETLKACRDCPMCHVADTIAMITGRELNTPRGRAMVLWGLEKGILSWQSEGIDKILYQAFLDGLPNEWCEGHFDPDELVIYGRKILFEKGLAPSFVYSISDNIKKTGNPWGKNEESLYTIVKEEGAKISSYPEIVVYFGSYARIERVQVIKSLVRILNKLNYPFEIITGEIDSGFIPYQFGDFLSASYQAKRLVELLSQCKAKKLVILGGSDYRMIKTRYFHFGCALPNEMEIQHVSEFFQKLFDEGRLTFKRKINNKLTYHDPCSLARFTYINDQPRKVLKEIAGENFIEMEFHGRKSLPCGSCGGVSLLYPEISKSAANFLIKEALNLKVEIIVSNDPACEVNLIESARSTRLSVFNFVELILEVI